MLYCLNPDCPNPTNPERNAHCQNCGARLALRNRFNVLQSIGQGGFGHTYLAQDLHNRQKPCVVKRFTYSSQDPQSTQKAEQLFEQEAERLDQLTHPQIPRLLAYFQEGDYLYLVQEFIEGHDLQTELRREGVFDEAKVSAVLQGLLPILQFIHSRQVIHRDLKPDNIMRRQTGELVLIDFGVAKLLKQSSIPKGGTNIGTLGYAAPEQMHGKAMPASDLFALGTTCFQLLTRGFDTDEIYGAGYGWVQHWQQYVNQPLSSDLTAILTRLLAVQESQRYSTATAVMRDFAAIASPPSPIPSSSPTVAVAPGSPTQSAVKAGRSHPKPAPSPKGLRLRPLVRPKKPVTPPKRPAIAVQKVPVSGGWWLKYGRLTYRGLVFGLVTVVVGAAVSVFTGLVSTASLLSMLPLLGVPAVGFWIGLMQWRALKPWLPNAILWLPATLVGFLAIAVAYVTGSTDLLSGTVTGLLVSSMQWAVLCRPAPRAVWWIVWATLTTVLLQTLALYSYVYALSWFLAVPLLDGLCLTWILRRQRSPLKP